MPASQHNNNSAPFMPSGRVEDFCFRLFFSAPRIICDFLCRSEIGMDGICFSSLKGSGLAHDKIFAGNTLISRA